MTLIVFFEGLFFGLCIGLVIGWTAEDNSARWRFYDRWDATAGRTWDAAKRFTLDTLWSTGYLDDQKYAEAERLLNLEEGNDNDIE